MRLPGIYSIVVGVLMLAQWVFFILTGQVPELQTEPIRIGLHLAAEAGTALALVLSGIGLLTRQAWGKSAAIFSLGMLMYTVIVSPGYFAQRGVWSIVVMFAILLVLDLVSLRSLLKRER